MKIVFLVFKMKKCIVFNVNQNFNYIKDIVYIIKIIKKVVYGLVNKIKFVQFVNQIFIWLKNINVFKIKLRLIYKKIKKERLF